MPSSTSRLASIKKVDLAFGPIRPVAYYIAKLIEQMVLGK
jgi:hypothetical protein